MTSKPGCCWGSCLDPAAAGVCVSVCGCVNSDAHRNHARWSQRAMLSQHHPWLGLQTLALPLVGNWSSRAGPGPPEKPGLILRRNAPTPHHSWGRNDTASTGIWELAPPLYLRQTVPVVQSDLLSYHSGPQMGLGCPTLKSTLTRTCWSLWKELPCGPIPTLHDSGLLHDIPEVFNWCSSNAGVLATRYLESYQWPFARNIC